MKQRGIAFLTVLPYLAGLVMVGGIIFWADRNIATTAGVKKGEAKVQARWDEAVAVQREEEIQRSLMAAAGLAEDRARRRETNKEITLYVDKFIDRPVYRNVCLDDSGLLCLRSVIEGKIAVGCKPDGNMPRPSPAN